MTRAATQSIVNFIRDNPGHTLPEYSTLLGIKLSTVKSLVYYKNIPYKPLRNFKNRDRRDLSWGQDGYFNPDAVKGEDTFLV